MSLQSKGAAQTLCHARMHPSPCIRKLLAKVEGIELPPPNYPKHPLIPRPTPATADSGRFAQRNAADHQASRAKDVLLARLLGWVQELFSTAETTMQLQPEGHDRSNPDTHKTGPRNSV
eukprot:scaffold14448_cov22-Tisochrysis_lutea.AAC.1